LEVWLFFWIQKVAIPCDISDDLPNRGVPEKGRHGYSGPSLLRTRMVGRWFEREEVVVWDESLTVMRCMKVKVK
jgi:hypothetical protein